MISAWNRDPHTGVYTAEMTGWTLEVSWTPNRPDRRGFFSWKAERGEAKEVSGRGFEEMEVAMASAETFARGGPASD